MLKLKLQYFGHLMQRAGSLVKTLILGKIKGRRKRGRQRMRWLDGITDSMDMGLGGLWSWWWTVRPGILGFMGSHSRTWLSELNWLNICITQPLNVYVYVCINASVGGHLGGCHIYAIKIILLWTLVSCIFSHYCFWFLQIYTHCWIIQKFYF